MENITQNGINTGAQQDRDPDNGRFVPGVSGNPNGRPKGALNFSTKWRIFLDRVAQRNNMSTDDVEQQLFQVALRRAQNGDYNFYRDIQDRLYGKAVQRNEHTGKDGEPLILTEEQAKRLDSLLD